MHTHMSTNPLIETLLDPNVMITFTDSRTGALLLNRRVPVVAAEYLLGR